MSFYFAIQYTIHTQDKTKNDWEDRDSFEKCAGKYDMVLMDYAASKEEVREMN